MPISCSRSATSVTFLVESSQPKRVFTYPQRPHHAEPDGEQRAEWQHGDGEIAEMDGRPEHRETDDRERRQDLDRVRAGTEARVLELRAEQQDAADAEQCEESEACGRSEERRVG